MELQRLLKAQELAIKGVLYAPKSFLLATEQQLINMCNGCGAADSSFRPPKRVYGTLIVYACIIHDWMYGVGCTTEDKVEADEVFHDNMGILIERDSVKWHKPTALQHRRALKYYLGVKYGGSAAFWAGKHRPI